jgi:hypothetical protein
VSRPAILDVTAPLHQVRTTLVALGANAADGRSTALEFDEYLLLLDEDAHVTTIAIGGEDAPGFAAWLRGELEAAGPDITCTVLGAS